MIEKVHNAKGRTSLARQGDRREFCARSVSKDGSRFERESLPESDPQSSPSNAHKPGGFFEAGLVLPFFSK
jgi:hypothetical protein